MTNTVDSLTHDEISELAANKLRRMGYIAAFANMTSAVAGEQPDAMGIKSCGESFLVEVKVSRADFRADNKKPWRKDGKPSLGHFRAYLTPRNLLNPSEIPYGWQLWEVHGTNKPVIKVVKGPVKVKESGRAWASNHYLNSDIEEHRHFYPQACLRSALGLMATVISRMQAEGVNIQEFASRNGKGFLRHSSAASAKDKEGE